MAWTDLQHEATTRSLCQVTNDATETLEAERKADWMVWMEFGWQGQGDKDKVMIRICKNRKTLQEVQNVFCSALYSSCLWFISVHVPVIHVHDFPEFFSPFQLRLCIDSSTFN